MTILLKKEFIIPKSEDCERRIGFKMKILFHEKSNQINTDDILELRKPSIREELIQTRRALEIAYSGFDNVTDPDLIDCYIYEVNSIMKRYKYLLEYAEKNGLLLKEIEDKLPDRGSLV